MNLLISSWVVFLMNFCHDDDLTSKCHMFFIMFLAKKSLSPFAVVTWGGGGSVRWVTNGDKGERGVQE